MAKEQQPLQRQILTPQTTIQPSSAFERMGDAAANVGTLIAEKANKIAIEQAAQQGSLAAEQGVAPEKLSLPLTAATKAYNTAVADTEATRMIVSAQAQIQEALINHTNPATFNRNTPAEFQATLEGIIQGTLENTRNENRTAISNQLLNASKHASLKMLQHAINFDNDQIKFDAQHDLEGITTALKNAQVAGDEQQVQTLTKLFHETLEDYSVMSNEIKQQAPFVREKFQKSQVVNEVLGNFSKSITEGNEAQFLADFMQNKQNLPFDVWQTASKELLALDHTQQKLTHQIRAQENQQVTNAINNGSITDVNDILNFPNLTVTDQLQHINQLETRNQKIASQQNKFLEAQNNILKGNAAFISSDTKNQMFANARTQFEQATGRPMSVIDMWESINGTNQFPASGIQGVPMGANVPQFDAQLTAQLTSGNPQQVIQASAVFNDAVNVQDKPNAINLTGDALSIASNFSILNTGSVPADELAKQVSDATLNAKDPEVQLRSQRFNQEISSKPKVLNELFKDNFGTKFQPGVNDAAMGIYKETLREHYLNTGSKEAAVAATKYAMRAYGTDEHFEDGMVADHAPNKELAITKMANAFDNQLRIKLQRIISFNREQVAKRDKKEKGFTIEWVAPDEQEIDIKGLTDEDRVFKRLGESPQRSKLESVAQPKPRVKINGHDTEVFLMPTPETALGERFRYALFYKDKFGMAHPIPDLKNPTAMAFFSPAGLEAWAPSVLQGQQSQQLKEQAVKFQRAEAKQEWESIGGLGAVGKLLPALETSLKLGKEPDKVKEVFRKMMGRDSEGIEKILRQRIQAGEKDVAEKATQADNVGIAAENTPIINPTSGNF